MKLGFGENISSLRAQRNLSRVNRELTGVYTRLSSGMRINTASDDAAGLAISESLNNDQRVFGQGIRNLNDGISLLSIADGAVEQLTNITIRLQELATQASNGSLGNNQRQALDEEAQQLSQEYFRIARTTEFNGLNLFDGSVEEMHLQAGYGDNGGVTSDLGGGVGDGTFSTPVDMYIPSNTTRALAIQTADLDGDGNIDMVGAGREGAGGIWMAFVRMGNGDGTFGDETIYEVANGVASVRLGDINNDGNLDIITSGVNLTDQDVSYRFGNGDGTFGELITIGLGMGAGNTSYGAEVGDFNGDGNLDIVTNDNVGNTYLLTGNGTGGFVETHPIPNLGGSVHAQYGVGDMNGDGIDDIVAAYESVGGNTDLDVYFSNGDGTFTFNQTIGIGNAGIISTTAPPLLVDFNNDGALDVLAGDGVGYDAHVLLNDGSGTLGSPIDLGGINAGYEAADFNGDGNLDVALLNTTDTSIYLGDGEGNFSLSDNISYSFAGLLIGVGPTAADVNNDGVTDLIAPDGNMSGAGGTIEIYIGNKVSGISPLEDFDLGTLAGAKQALPLFQKTLTNLTLQRGEIGAFESRLDSAVGVLAQTTENLAEAESRIRDADVAQEAADLVRLSIIQEAAVSIVGSANQQYSVALGLLDQG
ncbi:MAG: VCBS repeat-containing protein [Bdellovibrionales bacterium]|nr:VCBS repeat-containing protein [Bdellovibrionales bacterium]